MHIYLDNNSTTQPAPEVVDAMTRVLREDWGNPSSVHRFGQHARKAVDPRDWFYACHFYQDPVMPGSLGLEAMVEALQAFVLRLGLGRELRTVMLRAARPAQSASSSAITSNMSLSSRGVGRATTAPR